MNQDQFQRVKELTLELLSCNTVLLDSIREYCKKHHLPITSDPKIEYLVVQLLFLIAEINGTTPDSLLKELTPDEFAEPNFIVHK
jgi:hypothetical protein